MSSDVACCMVRICEVRTPHLALVGLVNSMAFW
uniref:Uncharacterized protein n=1 Tax=Arundo donax TaxID=35708 RepID=A0A0A9CBC0_ARUDO